MKTRLCGADRNVENGCGFLQRKTMLVVKKKNCSAGGGDVVEKREEGGIGWPVKVGIESQGSECRVVEGLPAMRAFEVADSDARGDTKSPGMEYSGLPQE